MYGVRLAGASSQEPVITSVVPGSLADAAGLHKGQLICSVGGARAANITHVKGLLKKAAGQTIIAATPSLSSI